MPDFKIGQRVLINPAHEYDSRGDLGGMYGYIDGYKDSLGGYMIDIFSHGLRWVHEDSLVHESLELSDWATIEATTGFNPVKGNV